MFVHHEEPILYPDGLTLGKICVQICTVTAAFVKAALKVSVLIENDLVKIKDTTLQYSNSYLATLFHHQLQYDDMNNEL